MRTNEKIESFRQTVDPKIFEDDKCPYPKETNAAEIYTFIGLVYARGLQGQNSVRTELLFLENYGHPIFSVTMSKNRFKSLFSKIFFDDFETRTERLKKDRFAGIRNIFEKFNNNCGKSIIPDDLLSIDETLYPMRNKVAFKHFNPNKPAKYGLLFKSINASRYPYSFASAPYCGNPVGESTEEYKPGTFEVTKHMVSKLQRYITLKGRNISFDRLYASLPLMNYLLEKDITAVGTLVSNRKGLPKEFVKTAGRREFSYEILWNADDVRMTLHSYVVKTKSTGLRNLLLLSTLEPIIAVTQDDSKQKSQIYKVYDFTKGETDIIDQRAQFYTCKPKSSRWTISVFSYALDTSRINVSTVWSIDNNENPRKIDSMGFGWELVKSLVVPYVNQRSVNGLSRSIQNKMSLVVGKRVDRGEGKDLPNKIPAKSPKRKCCRLCMNASQCQGHKETKSIMNKHSSQYQKCVEVMCEKHLTQICHDCLE